MSISPGQTTSPVGISMSVESASSEMSRSTRAIRSPSMSTSNTPSRPFTGSTTCPPFNKRFDITLIDSHFPGEQIQHCHPHGDAVGDLLEDHRIWTVGDFGCDLDTAVH